ncbi:7089_t:CDS:10 [Ambispora gerdemannii]|uniref:7089_t:CDS:1 n=1 Tax=Ambispora gerdemannii TaxID=144530 RepID=A0A9N8VNI6_9GLOM|nr:7089_t:CDS:10 [Ambispora gerdemannii]
MSFINNDSDSDTFVDAEDTFYDSNGRPMEFRYSAAVVSSKIRDENGEKFLLERKKPIKARIPVIPEISVTDTSLGDGDSTSVLLPSEPELEPEEEKIIEKEVVISTKRIEKKDISSITRAQNHNHTEQQVIAGNEPEVTVYIKDLDTGKNIPVTDIEEELKKSNKNSIDPLSLHILKRTGTDSEINSPVDDDATLQGSGNWDGLVKTNLKMGNEPESYSDGEPRRIDKENGKSHRRPKSFLNRLKKRTTRNDKIDNEEEGDENAVTGNTAPVFESQSEYEQTQPRYIKVRTRYKDVKEFDRLFLAQELSSPLSSKAPQFDQSEEDGGAIWTMKFSKDGKFLATGGKDWIVRVWAVISSDEEREHFLEGSGTSVYEGQSGSKLGAPVFRDKPMYEYVGHQADVLDLSWSKNNFLLSSSMDKTVRLWHITRKECLCCFQHTDFVTAIAFHPKDDRFFLSGSLDCKLRLWNIPEKKVAHWNELTDSHLVTAVGFTVDGKIAVAGSFTGLCLFYETDGLVYNTQIHVRSSRGRNSKGKKITGIEAIPGTLPGQDKLLISSNDSRIRLYNMRDKSLECKYKGLENTCSQIRATFSDDGRFIICGSEDRHVYVWNTDQSSLNSTNGAGGGKWLKKDKCGFEAFEAHSHIVTVAIFAPTRTKQLIAMTGDPIFARTLNVDANGNAIPPTSQTYPDGNIIVCADQTGSIKIFRNDSSYYPKKDLDSISTRSTRSWNSSLGGFLSRTSRRRRLSDVSSLYSISTSSALSVDAATHEAPSGDEEMQCDGCGSTEFRAFFAKTLTEGKSAQKSTLVCANCGKMGVIAD